MNEFERLIGMTVQDLQGWFRLFNRRNPEMKYNPTRRGEGLPDRHPSTNTEAAPKISTNPHSAPDFSPNPQFEFEVI